MSRAKQTCSLAVVLAALIFAATTAAGEELVHRRLICSAASPHNRTTARRPYRSRKRTSAVGRPRISHLDPGRYEFEVPHPAQGSYPAAVLLNVYGSRFQRRAIVRFNGKAVSTTFISPRQLRASIPFARVQDVVMHTHETGPESFHGIAQITVRNPGPHGAVSRPKAFPVHATPID